MEPGPTERHESDIAAVTTPAGGSDASGAGGGPVPAEVPAQAGAAGDSAPPKPRNRRGWMSDSPLDGGSGWPTSAYAIVQRANKPSGSNGAGSNPPAVPTG